jgi:hypothetical protein
MSISEDTIIITNIDRFTISFDNGNMILRRKKEKPEFNEDADFTGSKVISCYINNEVININNFRGIVFEIYKLFDKEFLLNNCIVKCVDGKATDKHYKYIPDLDLSFIGVNTNTSIREIVHLTKLTGTEIKLEIELENKKIVIYEN